MSPRRQHQGRCRGAAAVEFALLSSFLVFPLLFGTLQYGWYFFVDSSVSSAAGQLARRVSVGDCWAATDARELVKSRVSAPTTVTTSPAPATLSVGDIFTVTVTGDASVAPFFPVPDGGIVTVVVTSRLEDDNVSASGC